MTLKRHTVQKTLTYKSTRELGNHPTAEEIYERVRLSCPNISLGTVYRNLNVLCEEGLLLHIPVSGGADRFDHTVTPHYHVRCKSCGSVDDAFIQYNESIDTEVCSQLGYDDIHHEILFTGICPRCEKNKN